MQTIFTIARYDLLRAARERATFITGLLMPAIMMVLLGVAMGDEADVTITLDVLDEDGSALSAQFVALLEDEMADGDSDETFRLCVYASEAGANCDLDSEDIDSPDEWRDTADQRMEDTDSYGAIIIPAGFGEALRTGESVTVIYKNSAELSAPTLAEQKIDAAVSRMGGAVAIANLVVDVAQEEFDAFTAEDRPAAFDAVRDEVEAAWESRPVQVETEATTGEQISAVGFNQSGPGTAIMFVLISMLNASTLLVYEREHGTLKRLYTLPHPRWRILAGKLFGQYLYGLIQFALLIGLGVVVGVEWGDNVIGIALVVLVFTLTATALGMALSTVVRTSAQATNISLLLGLTLSPLGGAWWPLEIVPDFMKTIGHLSPVAWAMDAFQEMMFYSGGVIDILPMLGALLLMATVFFGFGVVMFRYE